MTPQMRIRNLEISNRNLHSSLSVLSGRMGELSLLVMEFGADPKIKQYVKERRFEIREQEKYFLDKIDENNTQIHELKKELA